jgi:hypothetical protein
MSGALKEDLEELPALSEAGLGQVRDLLFGSMDESAYAVLDGARLPGLVERLKAAPEESACLYRGDLEPSLRDNAPYLVKLRRESALTDWLLLQQWGRSPGVFAVTPIGLEALRRHFRGFLRVRDHTGKVLYFRWYDPRVLRLYLPTCNAGEIRTVYGPITRFLCEGTGSNQIIEFPVHRVKVQPRTVALKPI